MREIVLNICLVAIATALFRMLVPENGFKKQIGFLISCFFITAVVSFVTGGDLEFSAISEDFGVTFGDASSFESRVEDKIAEYEDLTNARRKRAIGDELADRVRAVLHENEIYPSQIYVIVNISDTYSISINEIQLVLPPQSDLVKASSLIEKEAGPGVKVTITAENPSERELFDVGTNIGSDIVFQSEAQ